MALPIAVVVTQEGTALGCCCGHRFNEAKEVEVVEISDLREDLDDFDVRDYVTTYECCPECGSCCKDGYCCTFSNYGDEEEAEYICGRCMTVHEEEQEAIDCCT